MQNYDGNQKKVHVVLSKEEIDSQKINSGKVVVVFDVLLATTTISALLHYGAKEIIPVLDATEALRMMKNFEGSSIILSGESNGKTIEGFLDPIPTRLKDSVAGKTVILSTTNGTVAIRKVTSAKIVYAASLLNSEAVAKRVVVEHLEDTVIAVCAGSGGQFCMEDFYGAGLFINELLVRNGSWKLTDSAKAALFFYQGNHNRTEELLRESRTGEMMIKGDLLADIQFASMKGTVPIVPQLENGRLVVS